MHILFKFIQGVAIGVSFVLPGLSAGTVILLLGFYRAFIEDLSRVNLKPYIPHFIGAVAGILSMAKAVAYLLNHDLYKHLLSAFLLGMLLASLRTVLIQNGIRRVKIIPLLMGAAGFSATWFFLCSPSSGLAIFGPASPIQFFIGGLVASATMLLPGVSGSAVLIILNIYDDVLNALNHWQWINIAIFSAGAILGLFGLSRILAAVYRRFTDAVSLLLAGLILGSTRVLLPQSVTPGVVAAAIAGAILVLYCSKPPRQQAP